MFHSRGIYSSPRRVAVKDMKPGTVFEHDKDAWMVIKPGSYLKSTGCEHTVWAVCLSDKIIGRLSYFGDGNPDCSFTELDVDAVIERLN